MTDKSSDTEKKGGKVKSRRPVGRPRNDGKPHLTRQRVFEVCAKLIGEHGYAGTGMRAMAAALDSSVASLFNLFGSKDGLLNELISYAATPSLEFYKALNALDASPEVKLYKSLYEEVVAVACADRDHAALFYLPELRKPELKPAQLVRARMIEHYSKLIAHGVEAGALRATNELLAAEQVFQLTETAIIAGPAVAKIKPKTLAKNSAEFCLRSLLIDQENLPSIAAQAQRLTLKIEVPA